MKVVLDTNVLVSGLIFGGTPGRILSAWADGEVSLVISPEILEEYRRVGGELSKDREHLEEALESLLAVLAVNATIVNAPPLPAPVCEDPDDDMFLAAALAAEARVIISGDKHLLRVSGWQDIAVLKPRQFVEQYVTARDS